MALFRTPVAPVTPMSRLRMAPVGSAKRPPVPEGVGRVLIDSLKKDICFERGSGSDKRRKKMGKTPSRTPAEILGIEDLLDDIEKNSPTTDMLR